MNILYLNCEDNRLIAINPDSLFSGGRNFDLIEVEFGDSWIGLNKSAVFYLDETRVFHVPFTGNTAKIPDDLLISEGFLYIGVYGLTDSGVMRKVSSRISVMVHRGSFTLGLTETGEDVYSWLQRTIHERDEEFNRKIDNKVDKQTGKGLSECDFTSELKTKLESLSNYDDSEIRNAIDKKVTSVDGMGLSHNDFTNELKNKLEGLKNYDDSALSQRVTTVEKQKISFPIVDGKPIFGTSGFSAKSDGKGGITWTKDPETLKNPFSVTFCNTDGSSIAYDGSASRIINLSDCNHSDINALFEEYIEFLNTL